MVRDKFVFSHHLKLLREGKIESVIYIYAEFGGFATKLRPPCGIGAVNERSEVNDEGREPSLPS